MDRYSALADEIKTLQESIAKCEEWSEVVKLHQLLLSAIAMLPE